MSVESALQHRSGVSKLDPIEFGVESPLSTSSDRRSGLPAAHHLAKFEWLLGNNYLSDVNIVCGINKSDEIIIPGHKVVLATHSPAFRAMFTDGWEEAQANEISMHYTTETCRVILSFIYTCDVVLTLDTALDVLEASIFYELDYLREATVKFLRNRVGRKTVFPYLLAALQHNLRSLKQHCLAFVRQSNLMSEALYSDELLRMSKELLLLLVEETVIDSDINILRQVHSWCCENKTAEETLDGILAEFLPFINLTKMTKSEIESIESLKIISIETLYGVFKNKVLGHQDSTFARRGAIHLRWDDGNCKDIINSDSENHIKKATKEEWEVVVALNKFSQGNHYWVYVIHLMKNPHDSLVGVSKCRTPIQGDPSHNSDKNVFYYEPYINEFNVPIGCVAKKECESDNWLHDTDTNIGFQVNFEENKISIFHHNTRTLLWTASGEGGALPSPLYPYAAIFSPKNGGVTLSDTTTYHSDRSSFTGQCGSCGLKSPSINRSPTSPQPRSSES